MLFSQAFEDRHFTECEISFGAALSVARAIRATPSLSSANNLRPEVHRDQANQWTEHCESNSDARNYGCGKLVIGRARNALQTQLPPPGIELRNRSQLSLRIFDSASIPGAAIKLAAAPVNGFSAANLKEPFPVCVFRSPFCCHATSFSRNRRAAFHET